MLQVWWKKQMESKLLDQKLMLWSLKKGENLLEKWNIKIIAAGAAKVEAGVDIEDPEDPQVHQGQIPEEKEKIVVKEEREDLHQDLLLEVQDHLLPKERAAKRIKKLQVAQNENLLVEVTKKRLLKMENNLLRKQNQNLLRDLAPMLNPDRNQRLQIKHHQIYIC